MMQILARPVQPLLTPTLHFVLLVVPLFQTKPPLTVPNAESQLVQERDFVSTALSI